jgi:hypothetical protein
MPGIAKFVVCIWLATPQGFDPPGTTPLSRLPCGWRGSHGEPTPAAVQAACLWKPWSRCDVFCTTVGSLLVFQIAVRVVSAYRSNGKAAAGLDIRHGLRVN